MIFIFYFLIELTQLTKNLQYMTEEYLLILSFSKDFFLKNSIPKIKSR